jgi:hypothetical protein
LIPGNEAAAGGGVHDLDVFAVGSPDDYEVRDAVGLDYDGDGREGSGFQEQHVIDGEHDLFRLDAELIRDFFQCVDGGAVDIGLAGFAQASIVDVDAETFEETF